MRGRMMVVDQSYAGPAIDLPVGQVVEIRLAETPSTGFRWTVTADGAPSCTVVDDRFQAQDGPPGHPGQHTWQLRAVQPGLCDFAVQYSRSWETAAPARTFVLHVRVS